MESPEPNYHCNKCEKSFGTEQGLRLHTTKVHSTNGKKKSNGVFGLGEPPILKFCPCCGTDLEKIKDALEGI